MSSMLASTLRRAATQPKPVAFRATALNARRNMASDAKPPPIGKTFKEAWLSDKGAWPVIGVIGFAVTFVSYWSISTLLTNPDVRINRKSRGTTIREMIEK